MFSCISKLDRFIAKREQKKILLLNLDFVSRDKTLQNCLAITSLLKERKKSISKNLNFFSSPHWHVSNTPYLSKKQFFLIKNAFQMWKISLRLMNLASTASHNASVFLVVFFTFVIETKKKISFERHKFQSDSPDV